MLALSLWVGLVLLTLVALLGLVSPLMHPRFDSRLIKRAGMLTSILLPVLAIALYCFHNDQAALLRYLRQEQRIHALEAVLQRQPDLARYWYLLAKANRYQKAYARALSAYARAVSLDSNNSQWQFEYAETCLIARQALPKPLTQSLRQMQGLAERRRALSLLALDSYQRGEYRQAALYWRQLHSMFTADTPHSKMIQALLTRALQHIH